MNLDARPRTLKISNGIPPLPTFSLEEMNRRLTLLRGHMQETGIDAVLFTSMHNINYYADFIYCAFGRNYGCVITSDQLTTISANIDGGQPGRQTFGHNNVVYTDWHQDNFFYAAEQLLAKARVVAIEFDHVTLQNKNKLKAALPGIKFVDIGEATMNTKWQGPPHK